MAPLDLDPLQNVLGERSDEAFQIVVRERLAREVRAGAGERNLWHRVRPFLWERGSLRRKHDRDVRPTEREAVDERRARLLPGTPALDRKRGVAGSAHPHRLAEEQLRLEHVRTVSEDAVDRLSLRLVNDRETGRVGPDRADVAGLQAGTLERGTHRRLNAVALRIDAADALGIGRHCVAKDLRQGLRPARLRMRVALEDEPDRALGERESLRIRPSGLTLC